jgi:hypothetical protein
LWPGRLRSWLGSQKDALSTIQAVATVLALSVGGLWTYQIFILEREISPHVDISQVVAGKLISPDRYWIQISLTTKNTGKSLVQFDAADITIEQITPLPRKVEEDIENNKDPISPGNWNGPWQGLCRYVRPFSPSIEAGESDTSEVEFVIPAWLQTVRIFTFLINRSGTHKLIRKWSWVACAYNLQSNREYQR